MCAACHRLNQHAHVTSAERRPVLRQPPPQPCVAPLRQGFTTRRTAAAMTFIGEWPIVADPAIDHTATVSVTARFAENAAILTLFYSLWRKRP